MASINFINIQSQPYTVEYHCHDYWELLYCTNDNGNITLLGGECISYFPNQIIIIPPKTMHKNISGQESGFISMTFINWFPSFKGLKIFTDNSQNELLSLLTICHKYFHTYNTQYSKIVGDMVEVIIGMINILVGQPPTPQSTELLENIIISNFSNANFDMDLAYDELSLCKDYARRIFTLTKGVSPLQFLCATRLNFAQKLLSTESRQIKEIAYMCGFSDPLYFSRQFKKTFGISPQNFSKCNQKLMP